MNRSIAKVLAQKGYQPILNSIKATVRDMRKEGYNRQEIKESIEEAYGTQDTVIKQFIFKTINN